MVSRKGRVLMPGASSSRILTAVACVTAAFIATGVVVSFRMSNNTEPTPAEPVEESVTYVADSSGSGGKVLPYPMGPKLEPDIPQIPAEIRSDPSNVRELTEHLRTWILGEESPESREAVDDLLANLSPENLEEILEMFNRLPRDGRQHEYAFTRLMRNWAAFDGRAALAFGLSAANSPDLRDEFYYASGPALETWAAEDLTSASREIESLALNLPEMDRNRFSIYLMEAFTRQDPTAAPTWIQSVANREGTAPFAAQCALALSRSLVAAGEADAARTWLQSQADQDFNTNAVGWMATHTALENPADAWRWLADFSNESMAEHGIQTMMTEMAGMNEETVQFWVDGFREGKNFDQMVERYATILHRSHPPAALAWADLIEDPRQRDAAISNLLEQWRQTDPESAAEWTGQNP